MYFIGKQSVFFKKSVRTLCFAGYTFSLKTLNLCTFIERKSSIFRVPKQRKDVFETSTSAIDRARRVLSGATVSKLGASDLANRQKKYFVLLFFSSFFRSIFGFLALCEGVFETSTSAIDRARRDLSGATISRLGASDLANRHRKN